jgi:hypothetical protein
MEIRVHDKARWMGTMILVNQEPMLPDQMPANEGAAEMCGRPFLPIWDRWPNLFLCVAPERGGDVTADRYDKT